jgi:predicted RND superfamily exporter protein
LDAIWRFYGRAVERIDAQPRRWLFALGLACLPALILTAQFFADVRSNLEELLPKSARSVLALNSIHHRLGGKAHLTVIAESSDAAANRRFISELVERLEKRRLPEVRTIQGSVAKERQWVIDHAPLLLPSEKFDPLMDELEKAVVQAKKDANPLLVDIDDDDDSADGTGAASGAGAKKSKPGAAAFQEFEKKLDEQPEVRRFPNGYLETPDGHRVVALIWLEGSEVELGPSANLLAATQQEVAAIRGRYPASMVVAYNGEVPNLIEEHDAILADLSISSLLVFLLVGGLIVAYFRSVRGVLTVLMSLVPGLLFTFAIGRLTVGHLNSNTAFLGSIIAGNGINYPLLLLAYFRTRPVSEGRPKAITEAARRALAGTLGAAVTASAAYGGLAASTFKGFSQFGWLGAMGMVTTWLFTFITMPIAISLIDPPRQGERPTRTQAFLQGYFRHPRLPYLVAGSVLTLALMGGALGVRYAMQKGLYEMDLSTLRNRDSLRSGSASWDARMSELFGVWLNPVAALVEDPAERERVAAELKQAMARGDDAMVERVETIGDLVHPEDEQRARIARLEKFRGELKRVDRDAIPPRLLPMVDAWFSPDNLKPIRGVDVPPTLRQAFQEVDGTIDRVVLVYPSLKVDFNDGRNILRFADRLATARLPDTTVVGGAFLFMGEIIRLVRDEAPRVVLVVCLLVGLVLLPFFAGKPLRIPLIVGTIATVAICSQAVMLALGVQLNMLNFAAVPITIGVGSDYVVNLLGAMDAFECDARRACTRMGGGIFLCSLTTIVGYISLVIAQSGALRTFGWAAVLGEFMAVSVVLLVLPAVLPVRVSDGTAITGRPDPATSL